MGFDPTPASFPHWADMIDGIRNGTAGTVEDLYATISDGARPKLLRQVGSQHVDDRLHEVVLIVLKAIFRGELREPQRFVGFVRTVTQRRVFAHIRAAVLSREVLAQVHFSEPVVPSDQWPDARTLAKERTDAAQALLARLCPRDREILMRFYYQEQDRRQICNEMRLTATQFRLFKSRALARCSDIARRHGRTSWSIN
jgi:RNA polymerase sigma-70 factor (ECF subfamily)